MSKDTIYREDAINVVRHSSMEFVDADTRQKLIEAIPSADRPSKVVAQVTFDEEKLHEIVKEALEHFKEEYEIADRPQGEWKDRTYGGRILHPWWESCECSQCEEWGSGAWNYCPHCGARMKGADDE